MWTLKKTKSLYSNPKNLESTYARLTKTTSKPIYHLPTYLPSKHIVSTQYCQNMYIHTHAEKIYLPSLIIHWNWFTKQTSAFYSCFPSLSKNCCQKISKYPYKVKGIENMYTFNLLSLPLNKPKLYPTKISKTLIASETLYIPTTYNMDIPSSYIFSLY